MGPSCTINFEGRNKKIQRINVTKDINNSGPLKKYCWRRGGGGRQVQLRGVHVVTTEENARAAGINARITNSHEQYHTIYEIRIPVQHRSMKIVFAYGSGRGTHKYSENWNCLKRKGSSPPPKLSWLHSEIAHV